MWHTPDGKPFQYAPPEALGFVYLIQDHTSGRFYIGKKLFWSSIKKKIPGKKRSKRMKVESNWRDYYGSSADLQERLEANGPLSFHRVILHLCKSKGMLSYLEIKEQIERNVLFSDLYYNGIINCRINQKHLSKDDMITFQEYRNLSNKTLYVHRPLTNKAPLKKWAKANGFESVLDDLHVTILFTDNKIDWSQITKQSDTIQVTLKDVKPEPLGDKGAIVLPFEDDRLESRWREFHDEHGAQTKFPTFKAHVSITYNGSDIDLSKVKPFSGTLKFGPEVHQEVVEDWGKTATES